MPVRSFNARSEPLLLAPPIGDLQNARSAALILLRAKGASVPPGPWATLFLTASLLECVIHDGDGVTRSALISYLNELARSGLPGSGMRASRLQFCRYAAAEVDMLTPLQRCDLIQDLLTAVAEVEGKDLERENDTRNDEEVRI